MLKKLTAFLILAVLLLFTACENKTIKNKPDSEKKPVKLEEEAETKKEVKIPTVCVWEKASLRQEPHKKGKFISSISLGEKLSYLGESKTVAEEKNKKYHYVELSDGNRGWVSEYVVALNSKPYVATQEISVYKRPDLSTLLSKKIADKALVAVEKKEGAWLKVTGEKNRPKGWIQEGLVTDNPVDIAVGLLATKALQIKNMTKRHQEITKIISNPDFQGSIFLRNLQTQMEIESGKLDITEKEAADTE